MVLNPDISGYVESMQSSGNNLTGASMDISVRSQFEMLMSVVSNVKKIGVMYDPQENQIVIDRALKTAKDMGIQLLARKVYSEKEVPEVLEDISDNIDALWAVSDSTIFIPQSIQFILLHTLRNSIVFMGISPSFVEAGALLALTCDYEDIGRQSGEIAIRVLTGEKPGNIPVSIPGKTLLSINLRTAQQIGVEIPRDIIKKADEVFGD
jgi:putative ABC transport system substrate-binding protein